MEDYLLWRLDRFSIDEAVGMVPLDRLATHYNSEAYATIENDRFPLSIVKQSA